MLPEHTQMNWKTNLWSWQLLIMVDNLFNKYMTEIAETALPEFTLLCNIVIFVGHHLKVVKSNYVYEY